MGQNSSRMLVNKRLVRLLDEQYKENKKAAGYGF